MLDQGSPWKTRLEAAQYARTDVRTIDRWARDGKLRKYFVEGTRSVRYRTEDLDQLMIPERSTVGASA